MNAPATAPILDKATAINVALDAKLAVRTITLSTLPGTPLGDKALAAYDAIDALLTELSC